jgi:hypothetical protein
MPEQEPNFEQRLENLKLAAANLEQDNNPLRLLDESRDLISSVSDRPANLLNDFMTQRRELMQLWQQAGTEARKIEIKQRIQRGLEQMIQALQKRPKI